MDWTREGMRLAGEVMTAPREGFESYDKSDSNSAQVLGEKRAA